MHLYTEIVGVVGGVGVLDKKEQFVDDIKYCLELPLFLSSKNCVLTRYIFFPAINYFLSFFFTLKR